MESDRYHERILANAAAEDALARLAVDRAVADGLTRKVAEKAYASRTPKERFKELLTRHLLPEFCALPERHLDPAHFTSHLEKLDEDDAFHFMLAWDEALIKSVGRGHYRAPRSHASEQFVWEGPRGANPRPSSLWLEPVITVAGLARLHFDYGWPADRLGTQSQDGAFDLIGCVPTSSAVHLAAEVKKSHREVADLVALIHQFAVEPPQACPPSGKARNAFKKFDALRTGAAEIFWAFGPSAKGHVFRLSRPRPGEICLHEVAAEALEYPFASLGA